MVKGLQTDAQIPITGNVEKCTGKTICLDKIGFLRILKLICLPSLHQRVTPSSGLMSV